MTECIDCATTIAAVRAYNGKCPDCYIEQLTAKLADIQDELERQKDIYDSLALLHEETKAEVERLKTENERLGGDLTDSDLIVKLAEANREAARQKDERNMMRVERDNAREGRLDVEAEVSRLKEELKWTKAEVKSRQDGWSNALKEGDALRAALEMVEWTPTGMGGWCPWCGADAKIVGPSEFKGTHYPYCARQKELEGDEWWLTKEQSK